MGSSGMWTGWTLTSRQLLSSRLYWRREGWLLIISSFTRQTRSTQSSDKSCTNGPRSPPFPLWELPVKSLAVHPILILHHCLPSHPSPPCPRYQASQWRGFLQFPPRTTRLPSTPSHSPLYPSSSRRRSVNPSSLAIRFISLLAF